MQKVVEGHDKVAMPSPEPTAVATQVGLNDCGFEENKTCPPSVATKHAEVVGHVMAVGTPSLGSEEAAQVPTLGPDVAMKSPWPPMAKHAVVVAQLSPTIMELVPTLADVQSPELARGLLEVRTVPSESSTAQKVVLGQLVPTTAAPLGATTWTHELVADTAPLTLTEPSDPPTTQAFAATHAMVERGTPGDVATDPGSDSAVQYWPDVAAPAKVTGTMMSAAAAIPEIASANLNHNLNRAFMATSQPTF